MTHAHRCDRRLLNDTNTSLSYLYVMKAGNAQVFGPHEACLAPTGRDLHSHQMIKHNHDNHLLLKHE